MVKIIKQNYERPDPTTNKNVCRPYIVADTEDELPAVDDFDNMILSQGSACYVIGTGNAYMFNSAGAWVRQGGEGGSSLPDVTADDNGDVLTVVEGEWGKAAPTKELPTVTSSDNGDVLTVVEGEWTKSAPQSPFKVVKASLSSNTITFENETQKSICEAIENGQQVIVTTVVTGANNTGFVFNLTCVNAGQSSFSAFFVAIRRIDNSRTNYYEFSIMRGSTSGTATLQTSYCDDYVSGGPT